jgi:hypothetical protein
MTGNFMATRDLPGFTMPFLERSGIKWSGFNRTVSVVEFNPKKIFWLAIRLVGTGLNLKNQKFRCLEHF